MDTLAHALWTNIAFIKTKAKTRWLGVLFGVLPDIISFGPIFLYTLLLGTRDWMQVSTIGFFSKYTSIVYGITHSLIIFAIVYLILYLITKKHILFLFGWTIHILIDIPTHSKDFYPTPYLYPFNSYPIDGISWAHPTFMIVNYGALVLVYGFLMYKYFRNHKKHHRKI